MTGAIWAVAAGLLFGAFQAVNRHAVRGMEVVVATFIQLLVSTLILASISLLTENIALLLTAPPTAWLFFGLAGFVHFFIGWTFLNASQKHVGAARTGSLIGTIPLFGIVLAALTFGEIPSLAALAATALIMSGVYLVNYSRIKQSEPAAATGLATGWRSLLPGLTAAFCWAVSPIFIRYGLTVLPSPMLGLTIGITASTLGYGLVLAIRGLSSPLSQIPASALLTKVMAGILVALATWTYWTAFGLTPVAIVLALALLSVPVVNILSPLVVERELEQVTVQVWFGSGLIVLGSLVLIFVR
jgi:drug/metabolite transporter (DMT)-like permease